jgi:hypothetical protein
MADAVSFQDLNQDELAEGVPDLNRQNFTIQTERSAGVADYFC